MDVPKIRGKIRGSSSFQRVINMSRSKHMDHMLEPNKIDNQEVVVLKLHLNGTIFEPPVEWFGKSRFKIYVFFFLRAVST
jgi:hypothetical protein